MWTTENRGRYDRSRLRYPSDLTDDEWGLVEPLIPPGKRGGDKRTVIMREVVNGLMYILSTGCQWRAIPKDLPPRSTLYDYFDLWSWDGTLDRIHHELYVKCREAVAREASPTAAVIDSQSVKSAEKGGRRSIGRVTTPERVRLEGAYHLWRKVPSRQLSIDLEADERRSRVTGRSLVTKAALGGRAIQRAVTRVKFEKASKESMRTPTRLLPGEGCTSREAIDTCTC